MYIVYMIFHALKPFRTQTAVYKGYYRSIINILHMHPTVLTPYLPSFQSYWPRRPPDPGYMINAVTPCVHAEGFRVPREDEDDASW
jgi:hypothetical protein